VRAVGYDGVSVTQAAGEPSGPAVRLDPGVMALIAKASAATWPGVPVVPVLEDARAHGKDERIGVKQFDEATRFSWELAKVVGSTARP
jgi:acetylornithine deacetylase/succinyl-diaminopimelate desuccinylase-like protein